MPPAGNLQEDLFLPHPVRVAMQNEKIFPEDFLHWLPVNIHVFEAFSREAKKIINRGYKHYSSVTIIEFLRHHTMLEERHGEWKLNNNHRPYLSRLFDLVYPQHAGLFEFRETKKVTREKGQD